MYYTATVVTVCCFHILLFSPFITFQLQFPRVTVFCVSLPVLLFHRVCGLSCSKRPELDFLGGLYVDVIEYHALVIPAGIPPRRVSYSVRSCFVSLKLPPHASTYYFIWLHGRRCYSAIIPHLVFNAGCYATVLNF